VAFVQCWSSLSEEIKLGILERCIPAKYSEGVIGDETNFLCRWRTDCTLIYGINDELRSDYR